MQKQSVANAPSGVVTPEQTLGRWGPVLKFPNAGIHTHLLPNGLVLMWGRRDLPTGGLNEHECTPFLWDPAKPTQPADATSAQTVTTPQPTLADGTKVNLFCGGHAFLPDGRLLAVGGHLQDGNGVNQACIYDFAANSWQATALMNHGRWYPTAITLSDGGVLVLAGSYFDASGNSQHNETPQVWSDGSWTSLTDFGSVVTNGTTETMDLYPRVHVISDGRVFMSGPLKSTWLLDTSNGGSWARTPADHAAFQLDYAPSVMYDVDKIVYLGGGDPPTNAVETIDLQQQPLKWQSANPMTFARRQHNATLLPDGTVLVTGGTRGPGFNSLDPGQPVHTAELWDPKTGQWTTLADEAVDRCYHSTAVLLPDATVLSAGGGEFAVPNNQPNDPKDTHRDGQVFSPPYLFKGPRPQITSSPRAPIHYGDAFEVRSPQAENVTVVTWIRLTSVTHAFNQSQRINFLQFSAAADALTITAPSSPALCPPGYYMLFLVSADGVPSVAEIVQIQPTTQMAAERAKTRSAPAEGKATAKVSAPVGSAAGHQPAGPTVVVGLTSNCPYGLGACWGGAHEALNRLDGVMTVNPVADTEDSTAEVMLTHPGLPALNHWVQQFRSVVNGRYVWRGVEITLDGVVTEHEGSLSLTSSQNGSVIRLRPLTAARKIQFDNTSRAVKPLRTSEAAAYERLAAAVKKTPSPHTVTVTGPLEETPEGYVLDVRLFET